MTIVVPGPLEYTRKRFCAVVRLVVVPALIPRYPPIRGPGEIHLTPPPIPADNT